MTTWEIRAHLREMYDVDVSPDLISPVTDGVLEEFAEWLSRPLDRVCLVIFIDALMVEIRKDQEPVRLRSIGHKPIRKSSG